jgi:tetratricopeptide (TPR) repeat protein
VGNDELIAVDSNHLVGDGLYLRASQTLWYSLPVSSNDAAPDLESELAAANQAIENLIKEVAANESRANALGENAWRWVFRYRRIQQDYLAPVYKALRRLTRGGGNVLPVPAAHSNGNAAAVARSEETLKKLIALARTELRHGRSNAALSVTQLIADRFPANAQAQRLVALVESLEHNNNPTSAQRAHQHLALGHAHYLLGDNDVASSNYQAALTFNPDLPDAHSALAAIKLPGMPYLDWLKKIYAELRPKNVIEIGVSQSASLACVPRPTVAIGVDPVPSVIFPLQTEAHIFAETSDEFFNHRDVKTLLGGESLSIGFIDGSHLFEQALRDFMHLESYCGPTSVIMFHDTLPLDEVTQRRDPETHFSTGDVWKTILCLKHYRPELDVFTIATAPTGLTVVLGLDPSSTVLERSYDQAVAQFIDLPFPTVEPSLTTKLNVVPNDWNAVKARFGARGIGAE